MIEIKPTCLIFIVRIPNPTSFVLLSMQKYFYFFISS